MSIDSMVKSVFTAAKKATRNAALQYSLAFSLLAGSVGCADRSAIGTVPPDAGMDMAAMLCVDEDQDGIYSTPKCGTAIDCNDNDASIWRTMHVYTDLDNDGFGAGKINQVCAETALPTSFSLNNQDCDDYNSAIRPGGQELCDGIDNDCVLTTADGSGEGAPLNSRQAGVCLGSQQQCIDGRWQDFYERVPSYETPERSCEGLDNNCDGQVDENLMLPFYVDRDGDGFGIIDEILPACTQPEGYASILGDCNDENSNINPSIEDICDSINNDCDEEVDEDASVCEKVVFISRRDSIRKIYAVNSNGNNLVRLSTEITFSSESTPMWSPDARRIYFINTSPLEGVSINSMKPDGSERMTIVENGPLPEFGYALSPDGTRFAFPSTNSSYNELYVVNTDGSGLEQLIFNNHTLHPVWSPDGNKIAFQLNDSWVGELYVINSDGTALLPLNNFEGGVERCSIPSWSPDSSKIVYSCEIEATREDQSAVYITEMDGNVIRRLTFGNDSYDPRWSPEGSTIAYFSRRNEGDDLGEVHAINSDGTGERNLTGGQRGLGYDRPLEWSPDGLWVAFPLYEEDQENIENIYVARSDGSELRRITSHSPDVRLCRYLKWTRDSSRIVYECQQLFTGDEIYIVNIDGAGHINLSNSYSGDVEFDLNF